MKHYCLQCANELTVRPPEGDGYCSITCENKFVKELRTKLQAFETSVLKEKEEKINEYLTEAMGGCWHVFKLVDFGYKCRCGLDSAHPTVTNNNFHTWDGFGKLWEWAIEQDWWKTERFHNYYSGCTLVDVSYDCSGSIEAEHFHLNEYLINPKRFAYAIYNFLKKEI